MLRFYKLNLSKKILFLALLVLLFQCTSTTSNRGLQGIKSKSGKVAVGRDSIVKLNIKELSDTVDLPLSTVVDNLEIVQLEDKEEAYTSANITVLSPSYIGIGGGMSSPFKLFDRKSGKFLANVGNLGRGPGEYINVYSAQIDEANNRVYLLPWQQQVILVYDLQGNPLKPIPTPYNMPKAALRVDTKNETVIIGVLPFEGIKSVVWEQDFKGTILSEVPAGHLTVVPDFSNEVDVGNNVDAFDFSLVTWLGKPDSLYNYLPNENRLKPVFTIDFDYTPSNKKEEKYRSEPNENAPIHSYVELPKYFMASVSFPKKVDANSWSTSVPVWLMVDKQSLKSSYFRLKNDFLGGFITWPSFSQKHYIYNSEPSNLLKQLDLSIKEDKMDNKVKERVIAVKAGINPDGNNIVIIGKIK
ncbi:MAG: 6-bladed beta-propeller [Bacteroidales bacterium]